MQSRSRKSSVENWLVTVVDLGPGESLHFNREHLTMNDVRAALRAQYPGRRDLVTSDHGNWAYVGVRDDDVKEHVWDRL